MATVTGVTAPSFSGYLMQLFCAQYKKMSRTVCDINIQYFLDHTFQIKQYIMLTLALCLN